MEMKMKMEFDIGNPIGKEILAEISAALEKARGKRIHLAKIWMAGAMLGGALIAAGIAVDIKDLAFFGLAALTVSLPLMTACWMDSESLDSDLGELENMPEEMAPDLLEVCERYPEARGYLRKAEEMGRALTLREGAELMRWGSKRMEKEAAQKMREMACSAE